MRSTSSFSLVKGRHCVPATESADEPLDILAVLRSRKTAWRVPELTGLLSLGRRTLYDVVDAGDLPAIKINTGIRISPSDALAWVEARTTGVRRLAA
jgi:excisionase family DNA binding protein